MKTLNDDQFTLTDLIKKEKLVPLAELPNMAAVFELVIPKLPNGVLKAPLLVGVDGSVTAGKTHTAASLKEYAKRSGTDAILIHGDWFMAPRSVRQQETEQAVRGSYSNEKYDIRNCDFPAIGRVYKQICDFLQTNDSTGAVTIPNAYDRNTGLCDKTITLQLNRQSIIVFEGTGVLRAGMNPRFDIAIRVDINTYDQTIERLMSRESEKNPTHRLDETFVKQRYDLIDLHYDQYLRNRDSSIFDILLDTSDPDLMKLYTKP